MRPYKGLDVLVAALALLPPETRESLRVVIAGEPLMDLAPLHATIRTAGLEPTVEISPRRLDDAEMHALFEMADAFAFPYREIEASGVFYLVQGLARWVIASRLGAFAEAIEDGVSGRLVTPAILSIWRGRSQNASSGAPSPRRRPG